MAGGGAGAAAAAAETETVLVTGGSGYLGQFVCAHLAGLGRFRVRARSGGVRPQAVRRPRPRPAD